MRLFLLGILLLAGSKSIANPIDYESSSTVAVNVSVSDVTIETDSESEEDWFDEARLQLQFIIGNFAHNNTPALWHTMKADFTNQRAGKKAKYAVTYHAEFMAAWTRPFNGSLSVPVIVPVRSDYEGLRDFSNKYLSTCASSDPIWYYFTPKNANCALSKSPLPEDAQYITLNVSASSVNTDGKSPEYGKLWEDGKLTVTHVMGNTESDIRDEDKMHKALATADSVNYRLDAATYQTQVTEQQTQAGKVVLRTIRLLKGNVQEVDANFVSEFQKYQEDSDIISYNGHAGLGQNVRAFTRMIKLTPGRYYLVWINACVPFAYVDDVLFEASRKANPGYAWTKFMDLLIVTRIGYFSGGQDINQLINVLAQKKFTYRQFLEGLASGQPAVLGEEDNNWPGPF